MKRTIVLMLGVGLLIALLLVAFDSDIKEANTHQEMTTHISELEQYTMGLEIASTQLETKEKITLVEPEPTQQVEHNDSSNGESDVQHVSQQEEATETMYMTATAYTAYCEGCSGTTYTGINLRENPDQKVIAVDPDVIPLGSTVWVEGYGTAVAGDIGGAIKGDRIDLFIPDEAEAKRYGVRQVRVEIID
ncbi:3D (Asp-Asp-Asp) domain-containing protein [Alkalibacillus filiformis]|uniref:3D (Asp-Asp-Asp) domain-containing protein n=1 Tax=Alkalibacillus filiformis TaxID=200990 RepID=A0ABU0DV48_9BACI|nr:3D domain-containing protein [Alkalibacillus filiformis]MDQ0352168.1 3D (Asp-Asp-Asp) domain-containing protein [Alkalibacillus filiformis]